MEKWKNAAIKIFGLDEVTKSSHFKNQKRKQPRIYNNDHKEKLYQFQKKIGINN